ncbi:hypothetical protein ACFVS2_19680 [Brevibacillus sp. NPDC058079]
MSFPLIEIHFKEDTVEVKANQAIAIHGMVLVLVSTNAENVALLMRMTSE